MKIPPVYSAQHTAALVRHWIETGRTPEEIERALIDKLKENYAALLPFVQKDSLAS